MAEVKDRNKNCWSHTSLTPAHTLWMITNSRASAVASRPRKLPAFIPAAVATAASADESPLNGSTTFELPVTAPREAQNHLHLYCCRLGNQTPLLIFPSDGMHFRAAPRSGTFVSTARTHLCEGFGSVAVVSSWSPRPDIAAVSQKLRRRRAADSS